MYRKSDIDLHKCTFTTSLIIRRSFRFITKSSLWCTSIRKNHVEIKNFFYPSYWITLSKQGIFNYYNCAIFLIRPYGVLFMLFIFLSVSYLNLHDSSSMHIISFSHVNPSEPLHINFSVICIKILKVNKSVLHFNFHHFSLLLSIKSNLWKINIFA